MATMLNLPDMLEARMSYDGERQKVLAENIANIDTPGYRAQDLVPLDFKNVLAAQTSRVHMTLTDGMHLSGVKPYTQMFRSDTDQHTFERTPTGDTVVVEQQMLKVAQNASDYMMTTNLYKKIGNLQLEALGIQPAA